MLLADDDVAAGLKAAMVTCRTPFSTERVTFRVGSTPPDVIGHVYFHRHVSQDTFAGEAR